MVSTGSSSNCAREGYCNPEDCFYGCRAAADELARETGPRCTCGEPDNPGTVHRTDGPCHIDDRPLVNEELRLVDGMHQQNLDAAAAAIQRAERAEAERDKNAAEVRAAALREAADALDESETLRDLTDDHMHDVNAAANLLRRMAADARPDDTTGA